VLGGIALAIDAAEAASRDTAHAGP
jgi:hypothetical protein